MKHFTALLITVALIFAAVSVEAQEAENVEQVARLYNQWDQEYNLVIQDELAYIATGTSGLQIVDISNPEEPDMVGYWDGNQGEARDVVVSGDYAFIADWIGGIYVINVSDPANPEYVSNIDTPGEAEAITLSGNNCFVADGSRGIRVFNVDNPEEMEFVGSYNASNAYDIKISGRYGYIVCLNDFHIVDIRNPDDIIEVGYLRVSGRGVDVSGGYAYVAGGGRGLTVIDISNPEHPEEVGLYDNRSSAEEIEVRGDYAYLANRGRGLRIIDISSPGEPTEVGSYETDRNVLGVSVLGDYAYIVDHGNGIHVIDISNPEEPDEIGTYRTPGWARDIFVLGDYAYVADDHGGLRIIEVSDPENPEEVGFFDTGAFTYDVFISGNYAYLVNILRGLRIIDISDPTDPNETGYLDRDEFCNDVYVDGNYAYMAASTAGLRLIDVSDPENPEEISSFNTPGNATGVTVAGEYCFIADRESVRVLNISDPEDVFLVDWVNVQGSACEIVTSENYAYIATGLGLSIIDIRDPYELVVTGEYRSPRYATGIALFENYAILGDELSGIRVIDVSDPENPEEVGFYNTPGRAEGLFVHNNLIYLADYTNIAIYRILRISSITASPDPLDFGVVLLNQSAVEPLTIINIGNFDVSISDISVEEDQFSTNFEEEFILEPEESYELIVTFTPRENAEFEGTLTITSDDLDNDEFTVNLHGIGRGLVWRIDISADVNDYRDENNYVGGVEGAVFGYDVSFDIPEPNHAPEGYIQLYFTHPEWEHDWGDNFTTDIVPDEAYLDTVIIWEFEVNTDQEDETVTLTFTPDDHTPGEYSLVLLDSENDSLQDLWDNNIYEYNSGEGGVHEFMMIFGDRDSPEVEVTNPNGGEEFNVDEEVQINWTGEDVLTGIASSKVSYSTDGGETFTVIDTTFDDTLELDWQVPDLYSPFCLVTVICTDRVGNEGEDQSDAQFAITPTTSDNDFNANWNLISIPLTPEDGSRDAVFGDDIEGAFWVYDYRQSRGLARTNTVSCGPGYWLATMDNVTLDVEGEAYIDTVTFELDQGWNLVGGPILWATPLDSVWFRADETTYTLDEAVDAELVQPVLYGYLAGGENYTEEDVLDPWFGYWFSVLGEDVQMLLYPILPTEEERRDEPNELSHESWQLTIEVTSTNAVDLTTTLGVDTLATDGFDARFDFPEPPLPPADRYVTAYFQHNDWEGICGERFNHDIRSEIAWGNEGNWTLTVVNSDTGDVTLSWSNIQDAIPEYYSLILEDLTTGQQIRMWEVESYAYYAAGAREFQIRVLANGINGQDPNFIPNEFSIISIYPNPFNSITTISYGLPFPTHVSLIVYDVTGREVAMLVDGNFQPGIHNAVLCSDNLASGMYIIRIESCREVLTQKVMLIR